MQVIQVSDYSFRTKVTADGLDSSGKLLACPEIRRGFDPEWLQYSWPHYQLSIITL